MVSEQYQSNVILDSTQKSLAEVIAVGRERILVLGDKAIAESRGVVYQWA